MSFFEQQKAMSSASRSLAPVAIDNDDAGFALGFTGGAIGLKRAEAIQKGYANKLIGGLFSAEEIRARSACVLTADSAETIDCLDNLKMGARNYGEVCGTCQLKSDRCPGHPGSIEIPNHAWFFHPYYIMNGMLPAIMNLFCYTCFSDSLKTNPNSPTLPTAVLLFTKDLFTAYATKRYSLYGGIDRLKAFAKAAKARQCHSSHAASYFKKNPDYTIHEHFVKKTPTTTQREVDAGTGYKYLKAISEYMVNNDMYRLIDFHPIRFENMVIQVVPVMAPRDRPAESMGDGDPRPSDITKLYFRMLNIIKELKNDQLSEGRKELREAYYLFINSDAKVNVKNMSNQGGPVKTVSTQMDGKSGLFLKKGLSSRVDNSGRTPITGDNSLNPNEARIPKYLAEKFRIELKVTIENRDLVQELVALGVVKSYTQKGQSRDIDDNNRNDVKLNPGDVVLRRMITGDAVIINRQPTLHRWSVLKMSAVVPENEPYGQETLSVGLNTAYLKGFNADFDGDEVHLHIPLDVEARADAVHYMAVENTPISDQSSINLFAPIQNTVWGTFEMTATPKNIDKVEWYALGGSARDSEGPIGSTTKHYVFTERAAYIESMAPKLYMKYGITGRSIWNTMTLLSLAFPPDFRYKGAGDVWIENGILLRGTLSGGVSGAGPRSIVQTMFASHGPAHMLIYVHVLQQVVGAWMQTQGKTMSIADYMPQVDKEENLELMKTGMLRDVEEIAQNNIPGLFNKDVFKIDLEKWMAELPAPALAQLSREQLSALRKEIAFWLSKFMHLERNLRNRGRINVVFRPGSVKAALEKAIAIILTTPEEITFKKPGELITASLKSMGVGAQASLLEETSKIMILRQTILDGVINQTIAFIQKSMTDPLDPEQYSVRSIYEKATIEADALDATSAIKDAVERWVDANPSTHKSMINTTKSGARGKKANLVESVGALGQQTMSGARLREGISGGTRVLPFFLENDPNPAARGFIRNNFFRGQTSSEFFSAAGPARQTQTDTAFKTGETGYMQKKLMAFCGDFAICADGSVRDEKGNVVTFAYGGDLIDPSRAFKVGDTFMFVDVEQLVHEVNAELEAPIKATKKLVRGF